MTIYLAGVDCHVLSDNGGSILPWEPREEATGKNGQVCCIVFVFCVSAYFVLYFTVCVLHILYCIEMYFIVYFARCVQCFVLCIVNKGWAVDKNGQAANDRKATNEERHCMRKI